MGINAKRFRWSDDVARSSMLFGFCIVDRKLGNISVLHSQPKVENTLVYPQPGRRSPAAAGVQISKELDFPQLHDIYGIIKAPHVGLCWSLTCGKTDIKTLRSRTDSDIRMKMRRAACITVSHTCVSSTQGPVVPIFQSLIIYKVTITDHFLSAQSSYPTFIWMTLT